MNGLKGNTKEQVKRRMNVKLIAVTVPSAKELDFTVG